MNRLFFARECLQFKLYSVICHVAAMLAVLPCDPVISLWPALLMHGDCGGGGS